MSDCCCGSSLTAVGGAPAPGECICVREDFTFATASPVDTIQQLYATSTVLWAKIVITTTFDDPLATLLLGTTAVPAALFAAVDSNPGVADTYVTQDPYAPGAAVQMRLTINPGISTQGVGYILASILL